MLRVVDEATEAIDAAWELAPGFRPFVKGLMSEAVDAVAGNPDMAPTGSYEAVRTALVAVASGFAYGYDIATRHSYSDFITYGDIPDSVRHCPFWDEMVSFAGCEGARDATLAVAASFVEQMTVTGAPTGYARALVTYGFCGAARGFELGARHEETGEVESIAAEHGHEAEDEAVAERMIGIVGDALAEAEGRLSHEVGIAFGNAPETLTEVRAEVLRGGFDFAMRCLASHVYEGGIGCDPTLVVGRIRTWAHHMLAGIIDRMLHDEATPGLEGLLEGADAAMGIPAGIDEVAGPALSVMWSACRRDQLSDEEMVAGIAYAGWLRACSGTGMGGPIDLAPSPLAKVGFPDAEEADEMRLPIASSAYACGLRSADRLGLSATDEQVAEWGGLSYELPDEVAWRESWDVDEDDGLPAWRSITYARGLEEMLAADDEEDADDAPDDDGTGEEPLVVSGEYGVYANPDGVPDFDIATEFIAKGRRAAFRIV